MSQPAAGVPPGLPAAAASGAQPGSAATAAAPSPALDASRTPLISLHALQRARTTVEDFALSYLPLHGLAPQEGLLRFLDVLVFTSAALYELDEQNERLTAAGVCDEALQLPGLPVLCDALAARGVLDDRVRAELAAGGRYWALERRICGQLGRGETPDAADVAACHESKSFDYRALHCVLHRLLGVPHDEALLSFLRLDELLVDVGDDLTDYEDDVLANSFNIYRCYIALHGPHEAQLQLIAYVSRLEAAHAAALAALPEATRSRFWARHKDASAEPGAEKWQLPRAVPIAGEAAFRRRVAEEEASQGAHDSRVEHG